MKIISGKSRNRERRDTLTMHKNKLSIEGKRLGEANRFKIPEKYLNESIKILPENYTSYFM